MKPTKRELEIQEMVKTAGYAFKMAEAAYLPIEAAHNVALEQYQKAKANYENALLKVVVS